MNRKIKAAFRVIAMALILFLTVQIIPTHAYAAEGSSTATEIPEQQELLIPADYERVLDEGYKTYTMDAGRGGTVVLDTENGKNTFSVNRSDIGFSGNRLGGSISWFYENSKWVNQYNRQSVSYHEKTWLFADYYELKTSNKSYTFKTNETRQDGSSVWKCGNAENMQLIVTNTAYLLYDGSSQISFNKNGKMTGFTDMDTNDTVQILYRTDGEISKIIDAVGREYRFSYYTYNEPKVSSITAYNKDGNVIKIGGRTSTVLYSYTGDMLSSVTYPDGKKATYVYEDKKLMSIDGVSRTVQFTYDKNGLHSITDGMKSLAINTDIGYLKSNTGNDEEFTICAYQDEAGNIDRVMFAVFGQTTAVYDRDWNLVHTIEDDNLITNGLFYDYESGILETNQDIIENGWEGCEIEYLPNGGIEFHADDSNMLTQFVEYPLKDGEFYVIGVLCPELYSETRLSIFEIDLEWELQPGLNLYFLEMSEEMPCFDLNIIGKGIIKRVFICQDYFLKKSGVTAITSCHCSKCETLACPCRCENEEECTCSQCVSRVIETKDKYGNLLAASRSAEGKTLKSTNTYTSNGDFLTSSTDENGVKVNYNYNHGNGLLESGSNENGTAVNYSYDAMGALKEVQTKVNGQTMSNQYTYFKDRLSSISHNGFAYYFDYDAGGRLTSTKVNNTILANYTYQNDDLTQITFANGHKVSYQYETHRITGIDMDNDGRMEYTYTYNIYNELDTAYDHENNTKTVIRNGAGVTSTMDGKKIIYSAVDNKKEKKLTETVNNEQLIYKTNQTQAANRAVTSSIQVNGKNLSLNITDTEDSLKRLSSRKVALNGTNTSLTTAFVYKDRGPLTGTQAQQLLTAITLPDGGKRTVGSEYSYDTVGNISGVNHGYSNGTEIHTAYAYDDVNQLTSEENELFSGNYFYDNAGNLYEKEVYNKETGESKIVEYCYDSQWKDLLVEYDGQPIEHDELGNVTDDGKWSYSWSGGRQLVKMESKSGQPLCNLSYQYDANGLRTKKTVETEDGVKTYAYVWANGVVAGMEIEQNGKTDTLRFLYDNGSPVGFILNETTPYFYIKNLMGDVCEIVDKDGNTAASYYYDAWGTLLGREGDTNILRLNPLTYRGYLYDSETGFYYLQTRYYNPEWNRFINADTNLDTQTSIIETNVFAYCNNNPVMQSDPTGQAGEYMDWLKNSPLSAAIKFLSLGIGQWLQDTFNLTDSLIIGLYDGLAALGKIFSDGMKLIYDVFVGDTISIISSIIEFGHSLIYVLGSKGVFDRAAGGIYSGIISSFSILLNLGTRLAKGGGSIDKYFIRDTVTDFLGAVFNIGFAVFAPPGMKTITVMLASTLIPKVITFVGKIIVR